LFASLSTGLFLVFLFLSIFFLLGPAQPSQAEQDLAAQPGHWPKPMTRLAS